jgi:hypothetical protein
MEEAFGPPTLLGPNLDFDAFKGDIEDMILQQGFSNDEVVADLASKSFQTSTRSLKRRLAAWNIRRERLAGEISDTLTEAVNDLFHTLPSDAEIASRIVSDHCLQTSARQVKSIRLLFSWLRRSSGTVRVAQQAATKQQVQQALSGGIGRSFGSRDNGGLSRPEAAPARTQESTQESTQEGARKSGRVRKPKSRD